MARVGAGLCKPRDRAVRRRVGARAHAAARSVPQSGRHRTAAARIPGRIRRHSRRHVHADDRNRRALPPGGRRRRRELDEPRHRVPADRRRGIARTQGARIAGRVGRQCDRGARDHRALRRLGRGQPPHVGPRRGRPLHRQRIEDLHHVGHAGRLLHGGRAYRRARTRRHLAATDRTRPARLHAHRAEQDGMARVGYGRPLLRRRARTARQPDRRREPRLSRDHAQLQQRTPVARHDGDRHGAGRARRVDRLRAHARNVRQATGRPSGDSPQDRRHGASDRGGPRVSRHPCVAHRPRRIAGGRRVYAQGAGDDRARAVRP